MIHKNLKEEFVKNLNSFTTKNLGNNTPRNQDTDWYGNDSEEVFIGRLEKFPQLLNYYISNKIVYKWNNVGFRSDIDFVENKDLKVDIFLGDSHTMGQGHKWENTWPFLVSEHTGNKIINLGVPGGSIETSYFALLKFSKMFNVQNVFMFHPIYARYSFPNDKTFDTIIGHEIEKYEADQVPWNRDYFYSEMINEQYVAYNFNKHLSCIRDFCNVNGFNFVFCLPEIFSPIPKEEGQLYNSKIYDNNIPARDLNHLAVFQMEIIADNMIIQLEDKVEEEVKRVF